jgi:glyoxylase-like metal-dependent hydrolase (beta-lactamase superfamily II)
MADSDSLDRIARNIAADGLDLGRLRRIILPHYHMEHAGRAARFREQFSLEVLAPARAAEALRTGDERTVARDVTKRAGYYDADYRFMPVQVDRELLDGDRPPRQSPARGLRHPRAL